MSTLQTCSHTNPSLRPKRLQHSISEQPAEVALSRPEFQVIAVHEEAVGHPLAGIAELTAVFANQSIDVCMEGGLNLRRILGSMWGTQRRHEQDHTDALMPAAHHGSLQRRR